MPRRTERLDETRFQTLVGEKPHWAASANSMISSVETASAA